MTVEEIIKAAGNGTSMSSGAQAICETSDIDISPAAIYKWPKIGIPDRYWPVIIKLTGATPDDLYQANVEARRAA